MRGSLVWGIVVVLFLLVVGLFWYSARPAVAPGREGLEDLVGPTPQSEEDLVDDSFEQDAETVGLKVAELLAEKFEKELEDVTIRVRQETRDHAMGLVTFKDEMSGGWWLAAREDGDWILVADGNGSIICQDIEPYDFPKEMVAECYDQETKRMIAR